MATAVGLDQEERKRKLTTGMDDRCPKDDIVVV